MTKTEAKPAFAAVNELFSKSPDGLRKIVRAVMQEMLDAEMTDALRAGKGERIAARLGYRSGYYARPLVTRVGKASGGQKGHKRGYVVASCRSGLRD
jgi:putative transposase